MEAVEEVHGKSIEEVISDVCLRKDGHELEDWRQGFKDVNKNVIWTLVLDELFLNP